MNDKAKRFLNFLLEKAELYSFSPVLPKQSYFVPRHTTDTPCETNEQITSRHLSHHQKNIERNIRIKNRVANTLNIK